MTFPEKRPLSDPVTPVTDASPKAFWRFQNDLLDTASVGPYPLTLTAGTVAYDSDSDNQRVSFDFDGLTYLDATGYKGILGDNPRAVSGWIKTTVAAASQDFLAWGDSSVAGGNWLIRSNSSGQIVVRCTGGNSRGTTSINNGKWHHFAVSLEADDTDIEDVKIYIDGVLDVQLSSSAEPLDTVGTNDVRIGIIDGRAFTGQLDEIAIFDGLTASEVLAIYNGGRTFDELGFTYKESTDTWVSDDLPRSGGRYKNQIVVLSDQGQIYIGAA